MSNAKRGLHAVLGSLLLWGLFPLYLRPLRAVPILEVIAHRIVWSCVLILLWMSIRGELGKLRATLATPALLWRLALTAVLISINWLTYVYAVANGHIVDTSVGYFINPLVNVMLGVLLLAERLHAVQWTSVTLAVIAVVYFSVTAGGLPWVSLSVAISFGLYGFVRKIIAVEALPGLAAETLILAPVAAAYLGWQARSGSGSFGHTGLAMAALLVGSGAYTAVPLFLFAYGARLIPYSTVGLLQYINPSLQLACGVLLFGETFDRTRAIGFGLIWGALAIHLANQLWRARRPA